MAKRSEKAKDGTSAGVMPAVLFGGEVGGKPTPVSASASALFGSAQPKTVSSLPVPSDMLGRLVETTFAAIDDPEEAYAELSAALDRRDAQTPGVLRSQLAEAPRHYRLSHLLYLTARCDLDRFEREFESAEGSMREEAQRELQAEKDSGLRAKAITDADVRARVAVMYPDEWGRMNERRLRADKTVEHLKHLVEVFKERTRSLRTLCGSRDEL